MARRPNTINPVTIGAVPLGMLIRRDARNLRVMSVMLDM